jgi:hypothetical protein
MYDVPGVPWRNVGSNRDSPCQSVIGRFDGEFHDFTYNSSWDFPPKRLCTGTREPFLKDPRHLRTEEIVHAEEMSLVSPYKALQ